MAYKEDEQVSQHKGHLGLVVSAAVAVAVGRHLEILQPIKQPPRPSVHVRKNFAVLFWAAENVVTAQQQVQHLEHGPALPRPAALSNPRFRLPPFNKEPIVFDRSLYVIEPQQMAGLDVSCCVEENLRGSTDWGRYCVRPPNINRTSPMVALFSSHFLFASHLRTESKANATCIL